METRAERGEVYHCGSHPPPPPALQRDNCPEGPFLPDLSREMLDASGNPQKPSISPLDPALAPLSVKQPC